VAVAAGAGGGLADFEVDYVEGFEALFFEFH
jgi:hypothetical protein